MRPWIALAAALLLATLAHSQGQDWPDLARIQADLEILTGARDLQGSPLRSRHVFHPDHDRARDWIVQSLESIPGMQVRTEEFEAMGATMSNVIGELPGQGAWVVVGAHYDSTASGEQDWDPLQTLAPGADDDASGVVAVLELARLAAQGLYQHPLRFVFFDGEEEGLLGSWTHVQNARDADEAIAWMVQLDPVGFNPGGAWALWATWSNDDSLAQEIVDASARSPLDVHAIDASTIGGDVRSDHYPFWFHGYPAVHVGAFPTSPDNHTSSDTLETVDLQYLEAVIALMEGPWENHAVRVDPASEGCSCSK